MKMKQLSPEKVKIGRDLLKRLSLCVSKHRNYIVLRDQKMILKNLSKKYQVTAGATDVYMSLPSSVKSSDVKKLVMDHVEDAKHEHGHGGYSGSWAEVGSVKVTDLVFDSKQEAQDYLDKTIQKYEAAIAVRYKKKAFASKDHETKYKGELEAKIGKDASIKKLTGQFEKAEAVYKKALSDLGQHKTDLSSKIMKPDASHLSCHNCKSKVAKQYVKNLSRHYAEYDNSYSNDTYAWDSKGLHASKLPTCPVCNDSLMNPVQKKAMEKVVSDLEKKRDAVVALKKELGTKKKETSDQIAKKFTNEEMPWLIAACVPE